MPKFTKPLAAACVLATGIVLAPAISAHESDRSGGAMMGPGMMGQGDMMNMMAQMRGMMESCNKMMQSMMRDGSAKPERQKRESGDSDEKPGNGG